jgi:cobalt-zinc-cadmium efflux system outer membrane protein
VVTFIFPKDRAVRIALGVLCLWGLSLSFCQAETSDKPLTLGDAYHTALARNLGIQAARAESEEAKADIDIARTRPNPSLNWDLSRVERTYRLAGIQQLVEVPGKHAMRVRVAKTNYRSASADYQQTVHNILTAVRHAYIAWIGALIQADIQKDNMQLVEALLRIAEMRFQAGDVAELDVVQARLMLNQARNDNTQAQSMVRQTQLQLAGLLNTPVIVPPADPAAMAVESAYPVQPLDALLKEALANRKDLQAQTLAIQAQRQQIHLFRFSRIPDVTLQVGFEKVTEPSKEYGVFVLGNVDIPIFDRQQGNLARAQATYQRLVAERALLEQQIRTDVTVNYERMISQQAQWENDIHTILPEAKEVETLVHKSYEMGKTGIGNALLAHQSTLTVRKQSMQAFFSYQKAISDLENALGRNPEEVP